MGHHLFALVEVPEHDHAVADLEVSHLAADLDHLAHRLVAEDVAEVIGFVVSRPSHVDLDLIVMRPRDQVSGSAGSRFNRRT